jgi:hypothetical protein
MKIGSSRELSTSKRDWIEKEKIVILCGFCVGF